MRSLQIRSAHISWMLVAVPILAVTAATVFISPGDRRWVDPELLSLLGVSAAAVGIAAAVVLIAIADRGEVAEAGLLGTALMGASVMPLVHGLTVPGVLFEPNEAFRTSAFLTVPLAVLACVPVLAAGTAFGRWAARRWRNWSMLAISSYFVLGALLVAAPDAIPAPDPRSPVNVSVSLAMVAAMTVMSLRQLRYYVLGGQGANFLASIAMMFIAATAFLPMSAAPYSATFWWMHTAGALGVIGVCAGTAVSARRSAAANDLLAPVLLRDPLVAFELGLGPTVHDFVRRVEMKDPVTRDHIVRTGEMAIRVGERFHLSARRLRNLGLSAMLHDIGKLSTPAPILLKPDRLTPGEYETIKSHPVDGETMLRSDPVLAEIAPIVRSHHERVDGAGYPDGLAGRQIPLEARIIAVCDAFDAMTHDRPYRSGMSYQMAFAVLREHSGSQWDPAVIDHALAVVPTLPTAASLDWVGRPVLADEPVGAWAASIEDVLEGAPVDVADLLATVDAEI